MGLFGDVVAAVGAGVKRGYVQSQVRQFCQRVGWPVEERGENLLWIHIHDPVGFKRAIVVNCKKFIFLGTFSHVTLTQAPGEITGHLLTRNDDLLFGKWSVSVDDGEISFHLGYMLPPDTLTETMFFAVCEEMAKEAGTFDAQMQQAGLLE